MHEGNIPLLELRRFLYELKDQRPDVCVRFRIIGEMWQSHFFKVVKLTESGAVLMNETTNQAMVIKDLREVVQFEIDSPYQNYQPHNHYTMEPSMKITERHVNSGR